MGQYNQAVLTTAGQALLTSILGNAGTLTFSKFQTSSYQYASGTDLSALTSLQSVEQNVVPSAGGIKDATTFYSSSTVPNTGVTVEYTNYTVGLFATDGDDEVLFAVSTAIVPDIIPVDDGGAPSTYTYTMSIGVSSTENFTVEVDDQGILRVTSIVDNLNSTSATQPLSANQGKVLNDAKQPKTLATPLTIGGTSQTTVEGALGGLITVKAERADITSISCTGATNDTGATILNGSEFYLNGVLCKAIADIANGATFTLNTNYETTTVADDLAELNSKKGVYAGSDFNDITDVGTYWIDANVTTLNRPISNQGLHGVLNVFSYGNGGILQQFTRHDSPNDIYFRICHSNSWGSWTRNRMMLYSEANVTIAKRAVGNFNNTYTGTIPDIDPRYHMIVSAFCNSSNIVMTTYQSSGSTYSVEAHHIDNDAELGSSLPCKFLYVLR